MAKTSSVFLTALLMSASSMCFAQDHGPSTPAAASTTSPDTSAQQSKAAQGGEAHSPAPQKKVDAKAGDGSGPSSKMVHDMTHSDTDAIDQAFANAPFAALKMDEITRNVHIEFDKNPGKVLKAVINNPDKYINVGGVSGLYFSAELKKKLEKIHEAIGNLKKKTGQRFLPEDLKTILMSYLEHQACKGEEELLRGGGRKSVEEREAEHQKIEARSPEEKKKHVKKCAAAEAVVSGIDHKDHSDAGYKFYKAITGNPMTPPFATQEQHRKAIERVLASEVPAVMFEGVPGSGKTASALVWLYLSLKAVGQKVFATAPNPGGYAALQGDFAKAREIIRAFGPEVLTENDRQPDDGSVVIIDEAYLMSLDQLVTLLERADKKNWKLILSGDSQQNLPPRVPVIGALDEMPIVHLFASNRAEHLAHREVISDFALKSISEAFSKIRSDKIIAWDPKTKMESWEDPDTGKEIIGKEVSDSPEAALVNRALEELNRVREKREFFDAESSGDINKILIIAQGYAVSKQASNEVVSSNYRQEDSVGKINELMHAALIKSNRVRGVIDVEVAYSLIDQITGFKQEVKKNLKVGRGTKIFFKQGVTAENAADPQKKINVVEGSFGIIQQISSCSPGQKVATIIVGRDEINLDLSAFKGYDYGYAITSAESQGMSIPRVFVLLDREMSQAELYVALSRHKRDLRLFFSKGQFSAVTLMKNHSWENRNKLAHSRMNVVTAHIFGEELAARRKSKAAGKSAAVESDTKPDEEARSHASVATSTREDASVPSGGKPLGRDSKEAHNDAEHEDDARSSHVRSSGSDHEEADHKGAHDRDGGASEDDHPTRPDHEEADHKGAHDRNGGASENEHSTHEGASDPDEREEGHERPHGEGDEHIGQDASPKNHADEAQEASMKDVNKGREKTRDNRDRARARKAGGLKGEKDSSAPREGKKKGKKGSKQKRSLKEERS